MATEGEQARNAEAKARVFISYSRKDMEFVDRLETALKARGFEPLIDRTEIYAFEDWWKRLEALIGHADTVVFVLSPDAVASREAQREVEYAVSLNKRFAPIVWRRVEDSATPEALRRLNFVFFDDPAQFESSADRLADGLRTDIGWIRRHTEFGEAARQWSAQGRPGGLLLRSPALEDAERWIASRPSGAPQPTEETQAFVADSRRGATRRRNVLTGSLAAGLLVALVLAGVAYWQRGIAVQERQIADQQRKRAEDTLAAATKTANSMVFDMAERFRNTVGMPAALVKDILDRAIKLQQQLITSGQVTPELRASEGNALLTSTGALINIGDAAGALAAASRARDVFEALVETNPGDADWQASLCSSYYWLGRALRTQQMTAEALVAFQTERDIAQRFSNGDKGGMRWQEDLATSYEWIGNTLIEQLKWDEALGAYRSSRAIRQKLGDDKPDDTGRQFALAVAFGKIGNVFLKQRSIRVSAIAADASKSEEALDALRKELVILAKLTESAPTNAQWLKELSINYDDLGDLLVRLGKGAEALDDYNKSLLVRQKLAESDPGNTDWQDGSAFAYSRIGRALSALGKWADARVAYEKGVSIWEKLAGRDPDHKAYQSSIVKTYEELGNSLMAQHKYDDALETFHNMLLAAQKRLAGNTGDVALQRSVSNAYERLGDALMAQKKGEEALDAYQKELAIVEPIAGRIASADWQFDVSIAYNRIGNAWRAQGRIEDALYAYRKYRDIAQRLADADPTNMERQYHLSVAYDKLGSIYLSQDKYGDALDAFLNYQKAVQVVADRYPNNMQWQKYLAFNSDNIGDAFKGTGKNEDALDAYRAALARAAKLSGSDSAPAFQANVYRKVGDLLMVLDRHAEALGSFQTSLAKWQELAGRDPANTQWKNELILTYSEIGNVLHVDGQLNESLAAYEKCSVIAKELVANEADNSTWQAYLTLSQYYLGKVLFDLGQVEQSLDKFNSAIQLGKAPDNSEIYWRRAVAKLYTKEPAGALEDAEMAWKLNPANPYYAIWLRIIRARTGQNDPDEFAANAKRIDNNKWPWPLFALYLGTMKLEQMRTAASSVEQANSRIASACEADFYVGEYQIEAGAQSAARTLFQSALDRCPHVDVAYTAAKLELKLLAEMGEERLKQ